MEKYFPLIISILLTLPVEGAPYVRRQGIPAPFACSGPASWSQTDPFLRDYAERWENSRQYLLAVAEAMPESAYGFRPTPEVMTFAEQLLHIATAIDWHAQSLIGGGKNGWRPDHFRVGQRNKQEIIALVNQTFLAATPVIKQFSPARFDDRLSYGKLSRTKRQIFLLLSDHVTHHRGEMLVYLRQQGITPPKYIEFQ